MAASPLRAGRNVALALVAAFAAVSCDTPTQTAELAPDAAQQSARAPGDAVPGGYIVVFERDVDDVPGLARSLAARHGANVRFTSGTALKGFAAGNMNERAAEAIAQSPRVAYVEPDRRGGIVATQTNATWGIDRIDQRDLPLDASYTYDNDGSGAHAYILDSGMNLSHQEFGGRAQYVPNGNNGDFVGDGHGSADDCHGHGSHVGGTVGGETYGVAQGTNLWAARVVNCAGGGDVSMAIAAVDWVTANAQRPAVVNMSLGYGDVQSLRDAVEASVAAGINYAVAAGNGDWLGRPLDACSESPAGAPNVNTVGATDASDNEASFSNYGTCVDILAPGVDVLSAYYDGNTSAAYSSGTSMASPHVAGAIALYLTANPSATPAQVSNSLVSDATSNRISFHRSSSRNGTPNLLLHTAGIGAGDGGDGGDGGTNAAPTASFTYSCTELSCSFDGSGSSDSDGTIVGYAWDFGDGSSATGATPSHTFASGGSYSVTLTVTDDGAATGSDGQTVSVDEPDTGANITLSGDGYKNKGRHAVDLTWSGAGSTNVDIFRDGGLLTTTANDGAHTDATNNRGGATYTYQVCEAGTSTCSDPVTVAF